MYRIIDNADEPTQFTSGLQEIVLQSAANIVALEFIVANFLREMRAKDPDLMERLQRFCMEYSDGYQARAAASGEVLPQNADATHARSLAAMEQIFRVVEQRPPGTRPDR